MIVTPQNRHAQMPDSDFVHPELVAPETRPAQTFRYLAATLRISIGWGLAWGAQRTACESWPPAPSTSGGSIRSGRLWALDRMCAAGRFRPIAREDHAPRPVA